MIKNYNSINIEKLKLLNDSSIEILFSSDQNGENFGTLLFEGVTQFTYQSIIEDTSRNDAIHIIEFMICQLDDETKKGFCEMSLFKPFPSFLLPEFKVELHGAEIDILFFCKQISMLPDTEPFIDLNF